MFIFMLLISSSVALNTAQLNTGPQTFTKQPQFTSGNNDNQLVNKQYSFYVAPLQLNAENQNIRNSETIKQDDTQLRQQDFGTQQREYSSFINFSPIGQSQDNQNFKLSDNTFNQKDESFYRQLQDGLKLINSYSEPKPREQDEFISFQQGSQLQKEFLKSIPKSLYSDKNQEQTNLGEELQQKWSRILGNKRVNFKTLSPLSDNQFLKAQPERPTVRSESKIKEEQRNNEAGNVIEYFLRKHGNNDVKENIFGRDESNSQNIPFVIPQQRSSISDNSHLKALSAISEDQFSNFAQLEQSNFNEEGQKNSEVRQQTEDIITNHGNIVYGKQNGFGTKLINYQSSPVLNQQRYRVLDSNPGELKAESNREEEQGNAEVRKLIEEIVKNRSKNNFGKKNGFSSEQPNYQGLSFFNREQPRQWNLNNNRVHLKALSTITEDNQFSKAFFGNHS